MIRKYPAVFLVPFIVAGIIAADLSRWPIEWFLLVSLVLCLVALAVMRSHLPAATVLFGLFLACFSAFHYGIRYYDTGPTHLANHFQDGKRYRIYGQVSDWPDLKSYGTEIKIAVDSIELDRMQVVHGGLMLKVSDSSTSLAWGDRIEFQARIYTLKGGSRPGGFDYRRYLNLKGVSGLVYLSNLNSVRVDTRGRSWFLSRVDAIRLEILNSFQRNLEPSPSALSAGFLIGEIRNIPTEVYQRFRDSGTLHLLAVSGSNVALVVAFMLLVLRPFGLSHRRRALVLLASVVLFAALSYGEPSVIRASIMAALVITAALVQRRYDLNNLIAVAAMAILLYDPAQLFNVGFQLSFVTAWGLIFIVPRLHDRFAGFHGRSWYRWLVFPVIIALTAQLCSAPLVAFYFHRVPLISPIANLVIVPLVSLAVVGSLCLLLADMILPLLGAFVGSLLNLLLLLILKLLDVFGGEQSQVWEVAEPSWLAAVAVYLVLVLGAIALTKRAARRWLVVGLLLLANVALVAQMDRPAQGSLLQVFTIPGGVAALYKQAGSSNGDLVITRIQGKPYPIDERVLAPALAASDIDKINSLLILSAEYATVDDMLRLASTFRADSLYVHSDLAAAFADVHNSTDDLYDATRIVPFSGGDDSVGMSADGWFAGGCGISLKAGSTKVLFVDKLDRQAETSARSLKPDILIVGQSIVESGEQFTRLQKAGLSRLVAAKVRPPKAQTSPAEQNFQTGAGEEFIRDLSWLGSVTIQLPENP